MCRVWQRLVGLHREVERLVTAVREHRLRAPRAARQRVQRRPPPSEDEANAAKAEGPPPTTPWEKLALPRGFGWLLQVVPETRQTGGQVQFWMDDPELPELLAKAPQLGRPLRSLCYMMGIRPPPALRPPPRPRRPRPPRPRAVRREPAPAADFADAPSSPSGPAAVLVKPPTEAEILSWMPGQKRPMPFGCRRRAGSDPLTPFKLNRLEAQTPHCVLNVASS
jgi:hypothetical protein